ncbi:ATP-binding protein [Streptomyces sp. NPDC048291]|uniref:ATP-binding protein n=1 Tax=Streptomyces sp. NPDC048291 TaxID=3365530 RepID=UPI003710520D
MTTPTFMSAEDSRADLIQVDKALESMRDAGYDLTAAAGEPLDNSIEADATILRVLPIYGPGKSSIEQLIFADDGTGIDPAILHHVLSMGYSTRYGQRQGLGRFGVGLKLAALSLGERIDVYSKRTNDSRIFHSYIDLQEISSGKQQHTSTTVADEWPRVAAELMVDKNGKPFDSGTVVIFGKIDRLNDGGSYGTSLQEKIADLRKFIARAYRTFIDTGRTFELDGKVVTLHDPLFLKDNPRIIKQYKPEDPRGRIVEETDLEIDGHKVHVTVALVPEEFRPAEGSGGSHDVTGRDIREFQINTENTGKISILRNGREIYYAIVPRILPGGITDKVTRYLAIEVSFPADLDEYFQVRHVKRGAEPVNKLRDELRAWLARPVKQARKDIRDHWRYRESQQRLDKGEHTRSMDSAETASARLPKAVAGRDITPERQEQAVEETIQDLNLDPEADASRIQQIREQIESKPITLLDLQWPGKELFDIEHLNSKSIVKLNHRHTFFREVYNPLKKVADNGADGMAPEDMMDLARRAEEAIDLLLMAYARAEGMDRDPEQFDQLRSHWGMFAEAFLKERFKD